MNTTFLWFSWNAKVADFVSCFRSSLGLEYRFVEEECVGDSLEEDGQATLQACSASGSLCLCLSVSFSLSFCLSVSLAILGTEPLTTCVSGNPYPLGNTLSPVSTFCFHTVSLSCPVRFSICGPLPPPPELLGGQSPGHEAQLTLFTRTCKFSHLTFQF